MKRSDAFACTVRALRAASFAYAQGSRRISTAGMTKPLDRDRVIKELRENAHRIKCTENKNGVWIGLNQHAVSRDGIVTKGYPLLVFLSEAEWTHTISMAPVLGMCPPRLLRVSDNDATEAFTTEIPDLNALDDSAHTRLVVRFWGMELVDSQEGTGDPRASLLSMALTGTSYKNWPFVYIWAQISEMKMTEPRKVKECVSDGRSGGEDVADPPGPAPSPASPSICSSSPASEETHYKPLSEYVYPDGTVRTIPAGYYTEEAYMLCSINEQTMLAAAVESVQNFDDPREAVGNEGMLTDDSDHTTKEDSLSATIAARSERARNIVTAMPSSQLADNQTCDSGAECEEDMDAPFQLPPSIAETTADENKGAFTSDASCMSMRLDTLSVEDPFLDALD